MARSSVRHEAAWAKQSLIRAKWPAARRDNPAFLSASSRIVTEWGAPRESKPAERAEWAGRGGPGARVTATEIQELEPAAVLRVPALLSVATTARLLDCSPRTVRRRIAEGSLPALVDHGRTLVRADELREYIDRLQRVGPHPPQRRHRARRYEFLRE